MSTIEHAKQELKAAGLYDSDSDYGGMLAEAVMKLNTDSHVPVQFPYTPVTEYVDGAV